MDRIWQVGDYPATVKLDYMADVDGVVYRKSFQIHAIERNGIKYIANPCSEYMSIILNSCNDKIKILHQSDDDIRYLRMTGINCNFYALRSIIPTYNRSCVSALDRSSSWNEIYRCITDLSYYERIADKTINPIENAVVEEVMLRFADIETRIRIASTIVKEIVQKDTGIFIGCKDKLMPKKDYEDIDLENTMYIRFKISDLRKIYDDISDKLNPAEIFFGAMIPSRKCFRTAVFRKIISMSFAITLIDNYSNTLDLFSRILTEDELKIMHSNVIGIINQVHGAKTPEDFRKSLVIIHTRILISNKTACPDHVSKHLKSKLDNNTFIE